MNHCEHPGKPAGQTILLFQEQQADIETRMAHIAYHQVAEIISLQKTQL